jgi:hypothetical protein
MEEVGEKRLRVMVKEFSKKHNIEFQVVEQTIDPSSNKDEGFIIIPKNLIKDYLTIRNLYHC